MTYLLAFALPSLIGLPVYWVALKLGERFARRDLSRAVE